MNKQYYEAEVIPRETYPSDKMLSKQFYEAVGRPQGTYLSTVPSELRKEVSRYVTACEYEVEVVVYEDSKTENDINILCKGVRIALTFNFPFMKQRRQNLNGFISKTYEAFYSFLTAAPTLPASPLQIGENQVLYLEPSIRAEDPVEISVYSGDKFTGIIIEVCEELLDSLEIIARNYNNAM